MNTNFIPMASVKEVYDFLEDITTGTTWTIQLHDKPGIVGGVLYGYRWSNNSFAEWFHYNDTNIYAADFWQMCDNYSVKYIERNVKRDGDTVSIIHAYLN